MSHNKIEDPSSIGVCTVYLSLDSSNEIPVGDVNFVMEHAEDIHGVDVKITSQKNSYYFERCCNLCNFQKWRITWASSFYWKKILV